MNTPHHTPFARFNSTFAHKSIKHFRIHWSTPTHTHTSVNLSPHTPHLINRPPKMLVKITLNENDGHLHIFFSIELRQCFHQYVYSVAVSSQHFAIIFTLFLDNRQSCRESVYLGKHVSSNVLISKCSYKILLKQRFPTSFNRSNRSKFNWNIQISRLTLQKRSHSSFGRATIFFYLMSMQWISCIAFLLFRMKRGSRL